MSDINVVFLTGRLGRDPEIRYLPSGTPVANMSVATGYAKKVNDEWQNETVWHTVKVFGNSVESYVSKLKKGDIVIVQGTLREDRWEDKDGNKRSKVFVLASKVTGVFTGDTKNAASAEQNTQQNVQNNVQSNVQSNVQNASQVNSNEQQQQKQQQSAPQYDDSDLPF